LLLPLPQEARDAARREAVGQLLHPLRVVAGEDAVGQFFVADAFLGQLPLEVFVAVETEFGTVREVGTVLEKERPEVVIEAVEVVLIDQGRGLDDPGISFAAVVASPFGAEGAGFLLSLANEKNAFLAVRLLEVLGGEFFFSLASLEGDQGDVVLLGIVGDVFQKAFGDGLHVPRRDGAFAVKLPQEPEDGLGRLQLGLIDVEVQAIQ